MTLLVAPVHDPHPSDRDCEEEQRGRVIPRAVVRVNTNLLAVLAAATDTTVRLPAHLFHILFRTRQQSQRAGTSVTAPLCVIGLATDFDWGGSTTAARRRHRGH
jgi:hypothetical protein